MSLKVLSKEQMGNDSVQLDVNKSLSGEAILEDTNQYAVDKEIMIPNNISGLVVISPLLQML